MNPRGTKSNSRKLDKAQLKMLSQTYDAVSKLDLLSLAQLDKDEVRIRIDESIAKVLGLPSLAPMRELLDRELGISAQDINPAEAVASDVPEVSLQTELLDE